MLYVTTGQATAAVCALKTQGRFTDWSSAGHALPTWPHSREGSLLYHTMQVHSRLTVLRDYVSMAACKRIMVFLVQPKTEQIPSLCKWCGPATNWTVLVSGYQGNSISQLRRRGPFIHFSTLATSDHIVRWGNID